MPEQTEDPNLTKLTDRSGSPSRARVNPAAVVRRHSPHYYERARAYYCHGCGRYVDAVGCEPYLLAVEVERLAGKVARAEAWRDQADQEEERSGRWNVVDMKALDAALADQPGQPRPW